ncbi:unnamed protein product [Porites lobata]|uniref:Uncharacterized protein n=1 Tax=Porites lobata TaxID=104759 RepID=A0ABN8R4M0_9CNID|nr:unnamed protein product [Porites lobata]
MMKAFCDTLSCLFLFCIHITYHSHIVNLVASDFKKGFKEVTKFVKCFRNLFFVPSGRKSRFLNFLQKALNPGDSVTMPPNPTTKSWSAWFDSVLYHAKFYFLFEDFVQEELSRGRNERMPHVTQAHEKMESLLQYLHANTNVEEDLKFSFADTHAKLCKYFVDGAQPALKFLQQI